MNTFNINVLKYIPLLTLLLTINASAIGQPDLPVLVAGVLAHSPSANNVTQTMAPTPNAPRKVRDAGNAAKRAALAQRSPSKGNQEELIEIEENIENSPRKTLNFYGN